MDKKTTALVVVAAICIGFGIGYLFSDQRNKSLVDGANADRDAAVQARLRVQEQADKAVNLDKANKALQATHRKLMGGVEASELEGTPAEDAFEAERVELMDQIAALQEKLAEGGNASGGDSSAELARLQAKLDAANATIASLKQQLAELGGGETQTAPLAYGEYGELDELRKADWPSLGGAGNELKDMLGNLIEKLRNGEEITREDQMQIGRVNGRLVQFALGLDDKLPTHAGNVNGEYTHPVVMFNMLAAQLEEAGLPLDQSQQATLRTLGEAYEANWLSAEARYTESTFALQKLIDELELKQSTMDQAFAMLRSDQRDAVINPVTRGYAMVDLYSPGLMLATHITPASATTQDEIKSALGEILQSALKLEENTIQSVDYLLADYARATSGLVAEETLSPWTMGVKFEEAMIAAKAQLALTQALMTSLSLSEEQRIELRDDTTIVIPRNFGPSEE